MHPRTSPLMHRNSKYILPSEATSGDDIECRGILCGWVILPECPVYNLSRKQGKNKKMAKKPIYERSFSTMKKNKMMRLASGLLVAVLLTTCAISGTFAKYVTSADSTDTARVAKFGVAIRTNGTAFSDVYETNGGAGYSVDSDNGDLVVAPGTTYENSALFSITGTPEVSVDIDAVLDGSFKDVFLKAGTYTDFTEVTGYDASNNPIYSTFTLANDYYPVVYTLKQVSAGVAPIAPVTGNLNTIKTALETYSSNASYGPNTNLNTVFSLTWEWAFDGAQELNGHNFDKDTVDAADTWLGNAAAGIFYDTVTEGMTGDYSTTIKFDLTITVTQID